jgi:hypothetical protein
MKVLAFVAALVAALLVTTGTAAAKGALRVLHASPNAPAVDVYVAGKKAVSGLRPGALTPYLELDAGRYAWAIRPKGAARSSTPVASGRLTVEDGKAATVAATGFLGRAGGSGFKVRVLADAAEAPFGAARIRVAHLAPDAPPVEILAGGKVVVPSLAYPRTTAYLTLPAGRYTFVVRPKGSKRAVATLRNVQLDAGTLTTAWALGALSGPGLHFRVKATNDRLPRSFARTQVRVLHGIGGAPNVDVYLNGSKTIADLAFRASFPGRGWAKLPSGPVDVDVRPAGAPADSAPILSADLALPAAGTVTVVASGGLANAADTAALRVFADDVAPLRAGTARVAVTHLGAGVPPVDVAPQPGAPAVVTGLAFGSQSPALAVRAGDYAFQVAVPALGATLPVPATLAAGTLTSVYAVGDAANGIGTATGVAFVPLVGRVTR